MSAAIVLQFSRGSDLGSDAIAWYSHGGWSHVDTVLAADGRLLGARSDCVGGAPAGVQIRDPLYTAGERTLRVEIPCSEGTRDLYEAFLRSQIGKPYDVEGIVGFVLGRDWRDDSAWFCSELVSAGLEHCGYFVFPLATPSNKITPSDLLLAISAKVRVPEPA